jgi:hypothetical protein
MKAKTSDRHGNVTIEFNSQAEAILSPDGAQKLLACDHCLELKWKELRAVSFLCNPCFDLYKKGELDSKD